jgi:hypothetical protein
MRLKIWIERGRDWDTIAIDGISYKRNKTILIYGGGCSIYGNRDNKEDITMQRLTSQLFTTHVPFP